MFTHILDLQSRRVDSFSGCNHGLKALGISLGALYNGSDFDIRKYLITGLMDINHSRSCDTSWYLSVGLVALIQTSKVVG